MIDADQTNGILIGLVADLDDEANLGRVRVTYPNFDEEYSDWARLATPMAGPGRGFHFVPEVGDEVLVAHEHGDPRRPYIVGSLWSTADPPPIDDGDRKANNWRFITSRSGHVVKLDDTVGAEKIEIVDQSGALHVVLDSAGGKIEVRADRGDVEVSAPAGSVTVEATTVEIKATGSMNIEAGGTLTLKGATVQIN